MAGVRGAGVGWLSVSTTKSLRAFVERVFANSRDKNVFFTIEEKQAICGCQGTYTYTDTFPKLKCPFRCLNMYFFLLQCRHVSSTAF